MPTRYLPRSSCSSPASNGLVEAQSIVAAARVERIAEQDMRTSMVIGVRVGAHFRRLGSMSAKGVCALKRCRHRSGGIAARLRVHDDLADLLVGFEEAVRGLDPGESGEGY